MAALTPICSCMDYAGLAAHNGLQWPCDAEHPEGTPVLHAERFPIGRARLLPVSQVAPAECPDAA